MGRDTGEGCTEICKEKALDRRVKGGYTEDDR